jgi:PTH1 family peptidyl-tRNA hydrolase
MILLVGLGNPGDKYKLTRHNIGFLTIDQIAETDTFGFSNFSSKFEGEISLSQYKDQKIILLKPMTFMNLSGKAVQKAVQFFKLKPENIIVCHDDMDLQLGKIKVKKAGGSGGHNGIKSIDSAIGKDYWRIRIGIGRPRHIAPEFNTTPFPPANLPKALYAMQDPANYVLNKFSKHEFPEVKTTIDKIIKNFDFLLTDIEKFKSTINQ